MKLDILKVFQNINYKKLEMTLKYSRFTLWNTMDIQNTIC